MKNEKFNELISQMEILTENEQGLLKGGFTTLSSNTFSTFDNTNRCNGKCPTNVNTGYCPQKNTGVASY